MFSALLVAVLATTNASWSCGDEDVRVTQHLEDALVQLKNEPPSELTAEQRVAREAVLKDLRRYIDEKKFPRSSGPTSPVFVDAADHHCAMGALIAWNGGADIVRHIRETRNLATVPTLANEPGLAEWLTTHGMTVEEAALVQPTYYECTPAIDACRRVQYGQTWVANGGETDGGWVNARVATVDGQCAVEKAEWPSRSEVPVGTIHQVQTGLVKSGDSYVHASWLACRNPLRFTQAALDEPSVEGCIAKVVAADPRALLSSCGNDFGQAQLPRCGQDGRFRSATMPIQGTAMALGEYLTRYGIDAGFPTVDLAALEQAAWAHSDDGGTVPVGDLATYISWNGTNASTCELLEDGGVVNVIDAGTAEVDAGTEVVDSGVVIVDAGVVVQKPDDVDPPRTPSGCSTGAGAALALVALLLRRRVTG